MTDGAAGVDEPAASVVEAGRRGTRTSPSRRRWSHGTWIPRRPCGRTCSRYPAVERTPRGIGICVLAGTAAIADVSLSHPRQTGALLLPLCHIRSWLILSVTKNSDSFLNSWVNKDNYLILYTLPSEDDSRVMALEVDEKPTEDYNDIEGLGKHSTSNIASVQQYWEQQRYLRKKIWLETWLRREIQALTRDENVEAIVYHIHGVIGSFMKRLEMEHKSRTISPEKRREEFRRLVSDAARPFLLGRTERFVTEVELFLVSNLNMEAYNKLRFQRFRESSSHLTREQDALPHDRSLEEHYLYFVCNDTDCDEM
ncbi:unnamed protein product [Miscanthus lutarioriparius]|uniref:Uncharacterized protein n=1 Tax=Miscanthus lutarioriparius TaxID=422564 RepID=A0A811SFB5_9POAL|nr:unnamed protein product [Miscanthus lutarioriparius]